MEKKASKASKKSSGGGAAAKSKGKASRRSSKQPSKAASKPNSKATPKASEQGMSKRDASAGRRSTSGQQRAQNMTTLEGRPVGDKTNSLTVGPRGPILLQDFELIQELSHFDRERIPERVVHAKGAGAYGYFEVTKPDIQQWCKASLFNRVGKRTPLFIRFSTVGGESGSADSVRDPRGFAVKFYTDEGNWDLVGNNTPIFFIRDPILFPSFIHTQKRNPRTHLKDANMTWDFFSLRPESLHQVIFLFSDRGIPDGYRHMNGYGSHTFKLYNKDNDAVYCKFHIKPNQGNKTMDPEKAEKIAGSDPDYAIRDLYNAIESGNFPSWTFYVQIMTYDQAKNWKFNPFDLTKVWSHKEFPLIEVGQITLNRNPMNYFAEVEQSAFSPANFVPGIGPSPDKMLQARLFSYDDTHRHRVGPNFHQIPVNRPRCPVMHMTMRDGPACVDGNHGDLPNYWPCSFTKVTTSSKYKEPRERLDVAEVDRFESKDEDNFTQVTEFYEKVLDKDARQRLMKNIAGSLGEAEKFIQDRMIKNLNQVHQELGAGVRRYIQQMKK